VCCVLQRSGTTSGNVGHGCTYTQNSYTLSAMQLEVLCVGSKRYVCAQSRNHVSIQAFKHASMQACKHSRMLAHTHTITQDSQHTRTHLIDLWSYTFSWCNACNIACVHECSSAWLHECVRAWVHESMTASMIYCIYGCMNAWTHSWVHASASHGCIHAHFWTHAWMHAYGIKTWWVTNMFSHKHLLSITRTLSALDVPNHAWRITRAGAATVIRQPRCILPIGERFL
jgi:hypothetical protein